MPTKMGNGGHGHEEYDASTGRYVRKGEGSDSSSQISENKNIRPEKNYLRNISDDELSKIMDFLNQKDSNKETPPVNTIEEEKVQDSFKAGRTINECVQIGNEIAGSPIVHYVKDTNLESANQMNRALYDIKNDFSDLMSTLLTYNNGGRGEENEKVLEILEDKKNKFEEIVKTLNIQNPQTKVVLAMNFDRIVKRLNTARIKTNSAIWGRHNFYVLNQFSSKAEGKSIAGIIFSQDLTTPSTEVIEKQNERLVQTTYSYPAGKGAVYSTAAHELGHFVDGGIRNFCTPEENRQLDIFLHQLIKENSTSEERKKDFKGRTKNISRYGLTNLNEFVAEAFSDYYSNGDKAKPFNKQIFNKYKQLYEEKVK